MKIAIIGTGNLGCSIAKGLITTNAITTLYLTKRNLDDIKEYEGYKNVFLTSSNTEAVRNSDILNCVYKTLDLLGVDAKKVHVFV